MAVVLRQALVADAGKAPRHTSHAVEVGAEECVRLGELTERLLGFAMVQEGALTLIDVDSDALAKQVVDELRGTADALAQEKVEVRSLPPCIADLVLLRQVWTSLLSNALKYRSGIAAPKVVVCGRREGSHGVFSVRDNGIGFDVAHEDLLFGAFQRLPGVKHHPGVGLGLAIARRIVERHGGRVWAESEAGLGATFRFSLPIRS